MKTFFITVLIVALQCYNTSQQTTSDPATYDQLFNTSAIECLKENNVDQSQMNIIFSQPDYPADKKPLQCFFNCLNMKLGVTDASGNINDVQLVFVWNHYENATQVAEINEECKSLKPSGSDLCEFGYLLLKCVAAALLD